MGRSFNQIPLDHFLSSFVQIGTDDASRNYTRDFQAYAESHWVDGVITRVRYFNRSIERPEGARFEVRDNLGGILQQQEFSTAGVGLTLKISWRNREASGAFYDKKDLRNAFRPFPDIILDYEYADRSTFQSDFDYQKVKARIRHQFRTGKFGYIKYDLEAGITVGEVPYTHLDVPFGNPTGIP